MFAPVMPLLYQWSQIVIYPSQCLVFDATGTRVLQMRTPVSLYRSTCVRFAASTRAHRWIIGYVCHELRNPLHVLKAAVAGLLERVGSPSSSSSVPEARVTSQAGRRAAGAVPRPFALPPHGQQQVGFPCCAQLCHPVCRQRLFPVEAWAWSATWCIAAVVA